MSLYSNVTAQTAVFLLAGGRGERLHPLTETRAKPVVPFAGIHRIIDFTLANCFNSGLKHIYIPTQYRAESIHRYIESIMDVPRLILPERGEFVRCVPPEAARPYRGTADAVLRNLGRIDAERFPYIVIVSGDHVYRMDYRALLQVHADRETDVTVAAVEYPRANSTDLGVIEQGNSGNAKSFWEKPTSPKALPDRPSKCLVSMGIYVFNTRCLMTILEKNGASEIANDFGRDILPQLIRCGDVGVYNLTRSATKLGSYWRDVGTLDSYYRANMEFIAMESSFAPWSDWEWPLYPNHGGLSNRYGCFGTNVFRSILSPHTEVDATARIEDSILMEGVRVGRDARIRRTIIEENVIVPNEFQVGYDLQQDRLCATVTNEGIRVITRNAKLRSPSRMFTQRTVFGSRYRSAAQKRSASVGHLSFTNLPHDCSEIELRRWIESHGFNVDGVQLIRDLVAGVSPIFAHVLLTDESKCDDAIAVLLGRCLRDRVISVRKESVRHAAANTGTE